MSLKVKNGSSLNIVINHSRLHTRKYTFSQRVVNDATSVNRCKLYLPGRIHSSLHNSFIIHMKRCKLRSCFLAITHRRCFYQLKRSERRSRPYKSGLSALANQIFRFLFARAIDDALNETAMLAAKLIL